MRQKHCFKITILKCVLTFPSVGKWQNNLLCQDDKKTKLAVSISGASEATGLYNLLASAVSQTPSSFLGIKKLNSTFRRKRSKRDRATSIMDPTQPPNINEIICSESVPENLNEGRFKRRMMMPIPGSDEVIDFDVNRSDFMHSGGDLVVPNEGIILEFENAAFSDGERSSSKRKASNPEMPPPFIVVTEKDH